MVTGDRCLVLPQDTDQLFCLDLPTGSVVWRAGLPQYSGHVVAIAETVVVGGWRGYTPMSAFDLKDGRSLWRTRRRMATVLPLPWDGGVLLGDGSEAWLIDPGDGRELGRWRLPEPLVETDGRPAFTTVGPDRCLVPCGPRSVVSIRLSSGLVERFFRHDADLSPSAAQFTGGVVWLREPGAGYLAVDPEAGSVLWNVDVRQPLVGEVVRDGEGFVVAGAGGLLFRLRSDGHVLERSSSVTRVAALRDLGAGETVMVTKGSLRMIAIDPYRRGE
nr:PQQ-binding-like beta-propeller repeat protein [Streptosporangium amethystogenes]